jgi:hypothetical protein
MLIKAQGVTVTSAPQQAPVATAPSVEKEAPTPASVQQQKLIEEKAEDETNEFQNPFKAPKEDIIVNEEDFDDIPFDEPPMEKEYAIPTDTIEVDNTPLQEVEAPQPKPVEVVKEEPQKKQPVDTGIVLDTDNAVPFAAWENTLNQLAKINRPLGPMLMGSTAYRAGNTIFIKAKNTAFPLMFTQKAHADSIAEALMRATGEKLKPMIYNDGSSPTADDDAEPIDSFLSKLDKHNIDFIVEE